MEEQISSAWMQTYTGLAFDPLAPRPYKVCILDIAHALSNQCRYAGHVREFYSVAEHCVRVSFLVPPADAIWGLLHDAAEAYLVDLPRPVKHHTDIREPYRAIEKLVMFAITLRFGLVPIEPESVKVADGKMLATEVRDLMGPCERKWATMPQPYGPKISPVGPRHAEAVFLMRAKALGLGWCAASECTSKRAPTVECSETAPEAGEVADRAVCCETEGFSF